MSEKGLLLFMHRPHKLDTEKKTTTTTRRGSSSTSFYYSASMALETWAKTSSTGSSESIWAEGEDPVRQPVRDDTVKRSDKSFAHLPDDSAALVEGDDGLCCFVVQVQALLDGLLVVVWAAAGLTALHEPLDHRLCLGVDVQQQAGFANLGAKEFLLTHECRWCLCAGGFSSPTFFSNSSPCFTSRG